MPTNDFLAFATGGGANVESQATYLADTTRTNGNQTGVAKSALNNKAIRQASFIASQLAQLISNVTATDVLDDTNSAKLLAQMMASLQPLASVYTQYTSGSGTHNVTYYFFIASGNATVGATYTNNAITYTVKSTVASAVQVQMTGNGAPTMSGTLTKASGTGDSSLTFYAVRAPVGIDVRLVGGGGGGAGSGTAATGVGGNGGNTTFGTTLLAGGGGTGGSGINSAGGGGTASLGTGPVGLALVGQRGNSGPGVSQGTFGSGGGSGGMSPYYGGAGTSAYQGAGTAATANSGAGGAGGGGSSTSGCVPGQGGGNGGFVFAKISSPLSFYAYAVGALGTAGTAGTNGFVGGAGAAGIIEVNELF